MKKYIRLSYSALISFLTCERMFQLDRLLAGEQERETSPSLSFGHSFGEGVATYLLTQDREVSLFKAFTSYFPRVEDKNKTEEVAYNCLICAFPYLDDLLLDWEVATFEGKPAIELSFKLFIVDNEEYSIYFVGYVDVVLRNKWTGKYAILENKHTGLNLHDIDPLYQNSGQALGYSIVLDRIAGKENSEYSVLYCVGQLDKSGFSPKIHIKEYSKSLHDRLNWFISLGMDVNRLEQMLELKVFPTRGGSCLQYMRPCKHLGTCNLYSLDSMKELPPDEKEYQFEYHLEELINSHVDRLI